jgi:hypothetical protein
MELRRILIVAFVGALLLAFPLPATAQAEFRAPVEEWSQTFGGSDYEWGNSVAQTSDGGYITAGTTYSYGAGNGDIWLIKTDADGDEEWDELFGGSGVEYGEAVAETSDGGYIVVGSTMSYGAGHSDVWLIKTDADGSEEWNQTFGGSDEDHGNSVVQTSDGGYIIAASTQSYGAGSSDIWLIKTDASGNEQWSELFGGSEWDFGHSVAQISGGGYIIGGYTESYGAGNGDVWLIKTDASGNEQWNETFGGSSYDYGYSAAETSDGYIITGYTQSYGAGSADVWLIKTDADGSEQWNQTFGGSGADFGYSVIQTTDGGYIVVGYTYSYGAGSADVWLIKTDADGSEEWNQTFGGSEYDGGYSVAQTSDGGYIVSGDTGSYGNGGSDIWLIKLGESTPNPPETVTVSIDAPDEAAPDSDFTADIDISDVTDFDSCNYDVTFDPAVLRLDSVASGLIGSTTVPVDLYNEISSGTYRVIQNVPGVAGVSGSGYLSVLHFHVIGNEGDSSTITLSNGVLSDNQAGEIEATWTGDSVEISAVVPGDGNGDGTVNALDITKVERVIGGLDAETAGADANGDDVVNALDITKIELIIAGLG